ncbi:unnamed protein product [Caenorhabditis brenneri]
MSALQTIYHQFGEEIYESDTCLYKSLKNEDYLYKKTLLAVMCQLAMARICKLKSSFAENILIFYLKNLKSRLQNHSEMMELPAELIVKTAASMELANLEFYKPDVTNEIQLFNSFKSILKRCGPEFMDSELAEITTPAFEAVPIKGNVEKYQEIVAVMDLVFIHLRAFYLYFFLPSDLNDPKTPVIRLFSNKNTHLVLANEVLENLKGQGIDVSGLEEEVKTLGPFVTWNFRELAGKVNMKNIKFVKIPLDLSDAECSIPTSNGAYINASAIFGGSEQPTPVDTETKEIPATKNQETEISHHGDATIVEDSCVEPTSSTFSLEESFSEEVPDSSTEKPTSESSCNDTISATEPSILKKKQKKEKKSRHPNAPKEVQPESNSCPKCIRSGEYSRATNEKLRISKVENKHLKKDLAKAEMENMEQKKIIEMLKQKLQEKEEDLQKKNTVIEVLDAEKEVIQLENQENKEKIKKLEEKLQTVKPATSTMSTQTMELPAPVINLSENAKDALFTLLNVRNTLKTENPLQKIQEVASHLSEKSHDKQIQITAKCEEKLFKRKTNFYINSVNSHVKWVLAQSDLPSNWDPCLPEFPVYSTKFQAAYKTILKADPPKICETLLKAPLEELEDKECVICSDDMESFEGTSKCERCKRRYHDGCIKNWFKVKRTCPMCTESMLDDEEFPQLS